MALSEAKVGGGWMENFLRPALIAGMMACLAAPLVLMLEWLLGDWDGAYFLWFCFFAGLEGILAERALRRRRIAGWAYLASRLAELVLLLLVLKLVNYIPLGWDWLLADARLWPAEPERFVANIDLVTGAIFVLLWAGALQIGRLVRDLEVMIEGPPADKDSTEYYLWMTQPSPLRDRQAQLDYLGELFVWGGMGLLLASSLIHAFVSSAQALALPILLYFGLGVALLSQSRYSVSRSGWQLQGIPVQANISRRWLVWALVFAGGVALLALFLPTSYALGPVRAVWAALSLVVGLIVRLLFLLYFLLLSLLALFVPNVQRPEIPTPESLEPFPPAEAPVEAASLPGLEILASAFFWLLIVGIVVYSVYRFAQDRFGLLEEEEARGTWWGRFLLWLQALWRRWRSWSQEVQAGLRLRRAARRERGLSRPGFFSLAWLRGLSPREWVRYFYLSAASRAARAGIPRKPAETPYEYRAALDDHFPDLEPDLTGLTEAFIEARYSRQPVDEEDLEVVRPLWQRIKAALRRRRIRPE
ncbi:MAG: DUF4129 domain-containing protein [Anaerolineae bacterium]|jgi:hypothetical protein